MKRTPDILNAIPPYAHHYDIGLSIKMCIIEHLFFSNEHAIISLYNDYLLEQ